MNSTNKSIDCKARQLMSNRKLGKQNPNYGRTCSEQTRDKISTSQKRRHALNRILSQMTEKAYTYRKWDKVRYEGFSMYTLVDSHDTCALYETYDLKNNKLTANHRVYYCINDISNCRDFANQDEAKDFVASYKNPFINYVTHETKTSVMVFGFTQGELIVDQLPADA